MSLCCSRKGSIIRVTLDTCPCRDITIVLSHLTTSIVLEVCSESVFVDRGDDFPTFRSFFFSCRFLILLKQLHDPF